MKYINILFLSTIILFSCNQPAPAIDVKSADGETTFQSFGKEISEEGAVSSSEIFTKLETEDSIFVKVNTSVNSVCKAKGCWMTVPLNDETEMRVKFKDYDFFVPLNCEDRSTIIEGWAYKNELSVATLQHYAADGGATEEEIAEITEPEVEYTFMADGVLMK